MASNLVVIKGFRFSSRNEMEEAEIQPGGTTASSHAKGNKSTVFLTSFLRT